MLDRVRTIKDQEIYTLRALINETRRGNAAILMQFSPTVLGKGQFAISYDASLQMAMSVVSDRYTNQDGCDNPDFRKPRARKAWLWAWLTAKQAVLGVLRGTGHRQSADFSGA